MKLPSLTKFLDIKDPREHLGPSKIEDIDRENLPPKEIFISWEHMVSVENKKLMNQRYYRPFLIIGIFVGLLLLIMQEFFVILIIGSLIFFIQAVMKMNPENVKYEFSNHGILIGETLYYWDKLRRYYFIANENSEILAVDTILGFPGRIYLYFNEIEKGKIKEVLDRYLFFLEQEPKNFFDTAYDKVAKKFGTEEEDEVVDTEKISAESKDSSEPAEK